MNNSKGPKIAIALGLVAIYGAGFAYVMLRDKPQMDVAQTAVAPTVPAVPEAASIPDFDPALADASTGLAQPPAEVTEAPATAQPTSSPAREQVTARKQVAAAIEKPAPSEQQAPREPTPISEPTAASEPAVSGQLASGSDKPAESAVEASVAEQPQATPSGSDSQITADVRAQIAAVAPTGSIDVTTRDGVVELTGSVPSEEQIDRVWLAARNVPDVRDVDVSALMVRN